MPDKLKFAVRKYEPFETALQKTWEAFCKKIGCKIKLEMVPMDLHPLHEATLGKQNGLENGEWDISHMNTDWISEAYEQGKIIDLKPYIDQNPPHDFPGGWSSSILKMQEFNDQIVGLPFHNGPECLIYRKDLFEDAKEKKAFEEKFGRTLAPPVTWEELLEVAHFFQRPEENLYGTVIAAYPDGHNTVFDFCLQLWTRGGELLQSDGSILIDTPAAKEGLEFYARLLKNKKAVHPKCRDFDSVQAGMAFANGEIAMMVNWFGFASMCEVYSGSRVKGKVDLAEVPSGPGGKHVSLNAYWMYAIGKGSKNKKLAYDFIRFATLPGYDKLLTMEGGIGCRFSTWQDEEINKKIPYYQKLSELHQVARNLPRKSYWPKIAGVIDQVVLQALEGPAPIDQILKEGQLSIAQIEKTQNNGNKL